MDYPEISRFSTTVAYTGTLQGFILFLITFRNRKYKSQRYLSWFILLLSVNIFTNVLFTGGFLTRFPYFLIFNFIPYLYGPLMYYYFYFSFYRNVSPGMPFKIHCIPAVFDFSLYAIIFFLYDINTIKELTRLVFSGELPWFVTITETGKMISGIVYSILIIWLILEFKKDIKLWIKNKNQKQWLISLAAVFMLCWTIVIINFIYINFSVFNLNIENFLYSLQTVSFVLAMYGITFFSIRYPALFSQSQVRDKIRSRLNLQESDIEKLVFRLLNLMQKEKLFLDETLTLNSLAYKLNLHPNTLSFIINDRFQKNFNEFINEYRLNHFIGLMENGPDSTILRLAYDSGFSSKSVFNKVFKDKYNTSPSEYLKLKK